ncbi:TetR family transcriptional regulator [Dulcicalothrix desertica PCC 7102]|uniref:TetR family transcriptional regulator n=1 Tax=Dulcicalothrix desertica PCC 7102 TaxID=232991 RepID=A0A3S1AW77_9CYAN|nr:TetR/AcrR family transcriptional regulator [Dulcicalothrix desertica]RUT00159.1 TetR family transcriptional regulator [Dulcicalothrix desertica PCC 7102]TWH55626.1 TetR family transcriptional regulator [Dulcicalothrix desertica PCC 7102]
MTRNKEETKARILAAVGKLLAESGFESLGVNAIAREAGVDKVLIYRYFDGLPSLLKCYAREGGYWMAPDELIGDESTTNAETQAEWMVYLLLRFLNDLKERPVTQEILRWELLERNSLTHELANVRDQLGLSSLKFLEGKGSFPQDKDIPTISAILIAGVVYLLLRTKVSNSFMGLDFSSSTGWQRVEAALESIIQSTFLEIP